MQEPSRSTPDKYLSAVYYTTTVVNELNFGLLIGMSAVVLKFSRVRTRRIIQTKAKNEMRRSNSDTSVYHSPVGRATIFESRGDKPVARESFIQGEK